MTYTSGNPTPGTAEAKLASRGWRYLNSWWIFPPILTLGMLGWLGFLVAGIRTNQRKYWVASAIYAVILVVAFTMNIAGGGESNSDGPLVTLSAVLIIGVWIVPTVHAAIINKDYLRTLAAKGAWYHAPSANPSQNPQQHPAQPFMGISPSDYYGAQPTTQHKPAAPTPHAAPEYPTPPEYPAAPTSHQRNAPAYNAATTNPRPQVQPAPTHAARVNITNATVEQLAAVPGVDHDLAKRLLAIRDARGGYRDLDDLAAAANLQPHQLVRMRDHITFGPTTPPPPQRNHGTGRILDI